MGTGSEVNQCTSPYDPCLCLVPLSVNYMVCRWPTLVCRCRILYLQHPTSVKNNLHFHTFCIKMAAARQKKQVNLLFCTHLAHFLHKNGCGSAIKTSKFAFFALTLHIFSSNSLHNPNKCFTFAATVPATPLPWMRTTAGLRVFIEYM